MPSTEIHPLYPGGSPPHAIAMIGDVHGNTTRVRLLLEKVADHADLLLQLGDFGFWRPGRSTDRYLGALTRQLALHDKTLLFLDGNHEDFDSLYEIPIDTETGLRKITNRIWHLPRGYRWTWGQTRWMALGGGVSMDQDLRTPGVNWWPQERITTEEAEHAVAAGSVDVVVAHDCPSSVRIPGIDAESDEQWPHGTLTEARAHRWTLWKITEELRPSWYWHGHYHVRYRDHVVLAARGKSPQHVVNVQGLAADINHWRDNVALANNRGEPQPWPEARSSPGPSSGGGRP